MVAFPFSGYVGLHSSDTGAEVIGKGYVRRAAQFVYCADGVTIANARTLAWPMASSSWGTLDAAQLWDAATGGTLLGSLAALAPVPVDMYDIARIPAGGMAFISVSVPRGYGTGGFGTWRYGTRQDLQVAGGVLLEITFAEADVCTAGTWATDCYCEQAA